MLLHTQVKESQRRVPGTKGCVVLTSSLLNLLGLLAHQSRLAAPSLHNTWFSVSCPVGHLSFLFLSGAEDTSSERIKCCCRLPGYCLWVGTRRVLCMPHGYRAREVCEGTEEDCAEWKKSDSVQCDPCHLVAEIFGVSCLP